MAMKPVPEREGVLVSSRFMHDRKIIAVRSAAPFLAIAWLLVFFAAGARADSVILAPVADADLRDSIIAGMGGPDENISSNAFALTSGKIGPNAGGEIRRIVLRFDLTGQVPPGAII